MLRSMGVHARRLSTREAYALVPVLRPRRVLGAVHEADAFDRDVHEIHHGYLRGMRRAGGSLVCNAEVTAMAHDGSSWPVQAGGRF